MNLVGYRAKKKKEGMAQNVELPGGMYLCYPLPDASCLKFIGLSDLISGKNAVAMQ